MGLGDIVFWVLLAAMVVAIIITIARGSVSGGGGGAGMPAVTALHDLSPADKQRAIEIVVENKGGKKWMEQESGKTKEPDGADVPPPSPGPEAGRDGGDVNPPA